jgi:tyrosyl-tRNA synthetase
MARFKAGAIPNDMPHATVAGVDYGVPIATLLKQAGLASSTSEAIRSIEPGGVRIDGEKVSDRALVVKRGTYVVQIGKRKWARVTVS